MKQFTLTYCFRESAHLARKDGTFPVQLAIYDRNTATTRCIMTKFGFESKDHFKIVTEGKPTKKIDKETKIDMDSYLFLSEEKAKSLKVFSISEFKSLIKSKITIGETVNDFYSNKIIHLKNSGQLGTASNYECSLKSLLSFRTHLKKSLQIYFHEITVKFLEQYERWMRSENKSNTTIGIYLRPLRSIINDAKKDLHEIVYPFHTKDNIGYKIPGTIKTNKALTTEKLKILFEGVPNNAEQQKAKAFFFFSYLSNGMNMKDIALLKWKDINDEEFTFFRAKTLLTSKNAQQDIDVIIQPFHKEVIEKYGNPESMKYVFPIIDAKMTLDCQRKKIQLMTRFVNSHIKKYAQSLNINDSISTNWARHSYSTKMMRDNVNIEFIRRALGHNNIATTQRYLGSFGTDEKRKYSENLLKFD